MVYIVIAGIFLLLAIFEINGNTKALRQLGIVAVVGLIVFAGFRKNVGLDYESYGFLYNWLKHETITTGNIEYGWYILNRLMPSFRLVLLVTAFLSVTIKWKAIDRLQVGSYVYTALFFYFTTFFMYYDMGIMRQGLAIGICYYAIQYIEKRSKKFFVCIAIAFLFHTTAIVFIPLYFLRDREFSRKFYYGFTVVAFVMTLFAQPLSNIVYTVLDRFGGALISYRVNYYQTYSEGFEVASLFSSFVRRVAFLVFFVEIFKRKRNITFGTRLTIYPRPRTTYTWIYINGYFLSIVIMTLFSVVGLGDIAGRMCASLYSLYIFLYIEIISDKRKNVINIVYMGVFVALALITMANTVFRSEGYIPYMMGW